MPSLSFCRLRAANSAWVVEFTESRSQAGWRETIHFNILHSFLWKCLSQYMHIFFYFVSPEAFSALWSINILDGDIYPEGNISGLCWCNFTFLLQVVVHSYKTMFVCFLFLWPTLKAIMAIFSQNTKQQVAPFLSEQAEPKQRILSSTFSLLNHSTYKISTIAFIKVWFAFWWTKVRKLWPFEKSGQKKGTVWLYKVPFWQNTP